MMRKMAMRKVTTTIGLIRSMAWGKGEVLNALLVAVMVIYHGIVPAKVKAKARTMTRMVAAKAMAKHLEKAIWAQ